MCKKLFGKIKDMFMKVRADEKAHADGAEKSCCQAEAEKKCACECEHEHKA